MAKKNSIKKFVVKDDGIEYLLRYTLNDEATKTIVDALAGELKVEVQITKRHFSHVIFIKSLRLYDVEVNSALSALTVI